MRLTVLQRIIKLGAWSMRHRWLGIIPQLKICRFDSRLEHVPRLQVWSLSRCAQKMFLSHWCFLSLFHSLSLSLKSINMSLGEDFKKLGAARIRTQIFWFAASPCILYSNLHFWHGLCQSCIAELLCILKRYSCGLERNLWSCFSVWIGPSC